MSLPFVLFEWTLFSPGDDKKGAEVDLTWALEALTQRNQQYLKDHRDTPNLYRSGVTYIRPAQMLGDPDEVAILRRALGSAANDPAVATVLTQVGQVFGGERFRDIGRVIENGGGDCFPLSQKIIARSKSTGQYELIALGDLRLVHPAYEALSYNFSTCCYEFRPIVAFIDKGVKPVSKAHLSNGTDLVATDDHKFWSLDGTGNNGRRVGVKRMGEYVEAYAEFKAGRMSKNMRGVRSRILQASRIPALGVTAPSTAETYLAGIYAAEGYKGPKTTRIAQHKGPVREKIEASLNAVGAKFSYTGGHGATAGSGAEYRVLGGLQNETVTALRSQGNNSFDIRFPQSFLSGDAATVRCLLDAHGDGDGWRPREGVDYRHSNAKRISVEHTTSSDALMEQIRLGLLILGRPSYSYHQLNHQGAGHSPIWRVEEFNNTVTKLADRRAQVEAMGLEGLTYATVRNAVPFGTAHVGCIEVEETHNFVLADGTIASNCDNFAAWRAAELRQVGIPARAQMTSRPNPGGGTIYHALVRWPPIPGIPYETIEDPSLILGMGGEARAFDRAREIENNRERSQYLAAARGGRAPSSIDSALAEIAAATSGRCGSELAQIEQELLGGFKYRRKARK